MIGSGECTRQAGNRVRVATCDGGATNGSLRVIGVEQEAEEAGCKSFFGDPASSCGKAQIVFAILLL